MKTVNTNTSRRQKVMRNIQGFNPYIVTSAILTSEAPRFEDKRRYGEKFISPNNAKTRHEELRNLLKDKRLYWFPVTGIYGGKEKSYIIYNISENDALYLGRRFGQESIIFIDFKEPRNPTYVFMRQTGDGEFFKESIRHTVIDAENETDGFTQISRRVKFVIPFFQDEYRNNLIKYNNKLKEELENYSISASHFKSALNDVFDREETSGLLFKEWKQIKTT